MIPKKEIKTINEISYTVFHWPDNGRTVNSPCACYGNYYRVHSTDACPWVSKRKMLQKLIFETIKWAAYLKSKSTS